MKFPLNILKNIRDHLTKEHKRVDKTLSSLRSQDPFSDPDRLMDNAASDTEAKEESSHERFEALEKEMKMHKMEIEEALSRIKKGTYGKCVSCHRVIDAHRLRIKPTALYCMNCEKKREK